MLRETGNEALDADTPESLKPKKYLAPLREDTKRIFGLKSGNTSNLPILPQTEKVIALESSAPSFTANLGFKTLKDKKNYYSVMLIILTWGPPMTLINWVN